MNEGLATGLIVLFIIVALCIVAEVRSKKIETHNRAVERKWEEEYLADLHRDMEETKRRLEQDAEDDRKKWGNRK